MEKHKRTRLLAESHRGEAGNYTNKYDRYVQPKVERFVPPRLTVIELLGSGSFGNVLKVIDQDTGKLYAVKRTFKAGSYVSREYEIAERLSGRPNIVQMYGLFYT